MLYGLYDTKNNEVCIGLFSISEIVKEFKISENSFYCSVMRNVLFRNRYEIVKFREKELDLLED